MKKIGLIVGSLFLAYLSLPGQSLNAYAAGSQAAPSKRVFELGGTEESSCYLRVMSKLGGIKESLDSDVATPFKVADKETLHKAAETEFDPSVFRKITHLFKDGEKGFDQLIDALAGQEVTPASLPGAIGKKLEDLDLVSDRDKIGLSAVSIAPFVSLGSGSGIRVNINAENHFLNIGYKAGGSTPEELAKAVKSGRSFGSSPGHKALDASDVFYLTELKGYLGQSSDPSQFYRALFDVLLKTDTLSYSKLSQDGQTVATDFVAIYTAELDRHLMTHLTQHPWENDLAEVTLLSAYGTQAGKIVKNGKLVAGTPVDYFGVGKGGSGIGETRKDRRILQIAVSKAARDLHPDAVAELEKYIGKASDGDVFHQLMVHINDAKNQDGVEKNAEPLNAAVVRFLQLIRSDADQITSQVEKQLAR